MDKFVPEQEFIDFLLGKSIAVVGNARAIRNRGKEIDDHDVVIRFNNFVIDGYEELVGTKTTIWAHTNGSDLRPRPNETFNYQWYPHRESPVGNYLLSPNLYLSLLASNKIQSLNNSPLFIDSDKNVMLDKLSTGVKTLLWLYYQGFQFNHYGFDGLRSVHYFNTLKRKTKGGGEEELDSRQQSEVITSWPFHNQQQEIKVMKGLNHNKLVEAIVTDEWLLTWATQKFFKAHLKTDPIIIDPHNITAIVRSVLSDNLIRKLTADARKGNITKSSNATFLS